jgi:hypothetical protein
VLSPVVLPARRLFPPGVRPDGNVIEVALSGSRFAYLQDLGEDRGMGLVRFCPAYTTGNCVASI